jgi:hypothetical protein
MATRASAAYLGGMTSALTTSCSSGDTRHTRVEPAVARHLRALFGCLPTLAGFRIRSDLMVVDVSATGASGGTSIRRLQVRVMQAIVEWTECDPEAVMLLRGRTFARQP